jgi:alkyl hydroperoxide reductase subunit AhpC
VTARLHDHSDLESVKQSMRWTLPVVFLSVLGAAYATQSDRPAATPADRLTTRPATARNPAPAAAARPAPVWDNTSWLNTDAPISLPSLKGRVVLLNFWVFTCYNCTKTLPALRALDGQYRERGLSIIGIHTPEFPPYAGEHDRDNVATALKKYSITYPIAQDNDRATWHRYGIRYWPSFVLIDKKGQIRHEGYGEVHVGDAAHAEWVRRIDALLAE